MAENGHGLEQPIFGDATIVPPSFIKGLTPPDATTSELMSGNGFQRLFEQSGLTHVGPVPVEHMVEIQPAAFIAVRRSAPDDALRYAESIRALLTASSVLTSGATKGFALTPLPMQWSPIPSRVRLDSEGKLQIDYQIVASNFIHLTPVSVTHKALRESWERGSPIVGSWKLRKEDALSTILVGNGRGLSGLRKRVRDAAATLARAMESTDPSMSTLFGAVALEGLLSDGGSSFAEIEQMASSIFTGTSGPQEIGRLFSNRHKVAHEAVAAAASTEHVQEVAAAWGVVLLAAMAAEKLSSVDQFLRHMRGRVLAKKVALHLQASGHEELAQQVEEAATHIGNRAKNERSR